MNAFHLSCRSIRPVALPFIGILCIYLIANVIYISWMDGPPIFTESAVDDSMSIAANVKFGKPDANGKVEVVLSLDMKELSNLINSGELKNFLSEEALDSAIAPIKLTGSPPRNVTMVLHDPTLCNAFDKTADVHWIFVIYSAPANAEKRSVVRETWANVNLFRSKFFAAIFLVGQTADSAVQESVKREFDTHHDIVQGDFFDTARNSTLKGLMGLQYVTNYCSNAKYLVKTNDDTFLNVFEILRVMETAKSRKNSVVCPLWQENTMKILRDPKTCMEWCVDENELPGRTHFPQYCAGVAFIISNDLVPALLQESRSTPYFWIDDVYITGLLLPRVAVSRGKIHYVDIIQNFTQSETELESHYSNKNKPVTLTVAKTFSVNVLRHIWKSLMSRLTPSQFKLLSDAAIAAI